MKKLISILSGFFLALSASAAYASSPCPNGSFNPQSSVCMCPNGGYVSPGEWCAESAPDYTMIKNWLYYSNDTPRRVSEIVADAKSQGYAFTKEGYIYELPASFFDNKARRQHLANNHGKQGLIFARFPAKVHRLQAEYIAAVKQGNNMPATNNVPAERTGGRNISSTVKLIAPN